MELLNSLTVVQCKYIIYHVFESVHEQCIMNPKKHVKRFQVILHKFQTLIKKRKGICFYFSPQKISNPNTCILYKHLEFLSILNVISNTKHVLNHIIIESHLVIICQKKILKDVVQSKFLFGDFINLGALKS